jgi:hypothetical protein
VTLDFGLPKPRVGVLSSARSDAAGPTVGAAGPGTGVRSRAGLAGVQGGGQRLTGSQGALGNRDGAVPWLPLDGPGLLRLSWPAQDGGSCPRPAEGGIEAFGCLPHWCGLCGVLLCLAQLDAAVASLTRLAARVSAVTRRTRPRPSSGEEDGISAACPEAMCGDHLPRCCAGP